MERCMLRLQWHAIPQQLAQVQAQLTHSPACLHLRSDAN
jgi:hypothetical protein